MVCECSPPFFTLRLHRIPYHTHARFSQDCVGSCVCLPRADAQVSTWSSDVHGCSHGSRAQGVTCGACSQVSVYTCHEPWSAPGVPALTFRPDPWTTRHQVPGGVQSFPFPPERSSGQHTRLQILRLLPAPGRIHPWAQLGQSPPPASSQACPFHRQYW